MKQNLLRKKTQAGRGMQYRCLITFLQSFCLPQLPPQSQISCLVKKHLMKSPLTDRCPWLCWDDERLLALCSRRILVGLYSESIHRFQGQRQPLLRRERGFWSCAELLSPNRRVAFVQHCQCKCKAASMQSFINPSLVLFFRSKVLTVHWSSCSVIVCRV